MRKNGYSLASLAVASVLHGMIHTLSLFLSPLNAEIARYFGFASISSVTSFKTSYLFVYAASNLVFGALAHRVSARRTLAFGMALNAAAVLAFGFVPKDGSLWMYALWMAAAVGGGVYHPVANAYVTRVFSERKGWALGMTGMGAGIGFAFGPFATGFLSGGLGLDWRQVSLVFGALGLACAAAAFIVLEEERGGPNEAPRVSAAADPRPSARGNLLGLPLPIWGFLAFITLVAGSRDFAMWCILDVSDFYLKTLFGGTANTAWYLFVLYLPGILFQPMGGILSDRIGRKRLTFVSLAVYGSGIASLALLPPALLPLSYCLMGAGQSASTPVVDALVADYAAPRLRGLIFGVYITAAMACGALGPLFAGFFLDARGRTLDAFQSWMLLLGAVVLAGAFAMLFSERVIAGLGLAKVRSEGEK